MKMLKEKLLAYILSFLVILGFLPVTALAGEANPFPLQVNGIDIGKEPDGTIMCGDGTAIYDSGTNTLTLNNATINSGKNTAIDCSNDLPVIRLEGDNRITCEDRGIYTSTSPDNSGKQLIFEGDGSLTINSGGDAIQADYRDIVIDGSELNIFSEYHGIGAYGGKLILQNGADVTVNSTETAMAGENGIEITESTVEAAVSLSKKNVFYSAQGTVMMKKSTVNVKTTATGAYPTIWGSGIEISDGSEVIAESTDSNALYSPNEIIASDSTLEARSTEWAIFCDGPIDISGGVIKAYDTGGDYTNASIYASNTLTVSNGADVLADGGIDTNSIRIVPVEGKLVEYKAGIHENGEEGTKHRGHSPYEEEFSFGYEDIELGYTYVHIKEHIHMGGVATCIDCAVCTDCKKEYGDIASDNHAGDIVWTKTATTHSGVYNCCNTPIATEEAHEWSDGKCSICGYVYPYTGGGTTVHRVTLKGIVITDKVYDAKKAAYTGTPVAITGNGTVVDIPAEAYTYTWYETDGRRLEEAPVDAGEYKLVISVNNGSYAGTQELKFKITRREVTAVIDDKEMEINEEVPELTISYEGFAGEDNKDNALITQAELTTNADGKNLGDYDITFRTAPVLNDAAAKNYILKCDDKGILKVVEKPVYLLAKTGSKKTSVKVSWNKVEEADGYLVYGAECGKSYQLLKKVSAGKASYEQKNLKKGKSYKFYVTAYHLKDGKRETIVTSPKVHIMTKGGRYGNPTKVSVSDKTVTVSRGETTKITARVSKTNGKVKNHVAAVRYLSTDKSVATVTAKGKIKGIKAGTCYVYCYAQDGVAAKVKVTVK